MKAITLAALIVLVGCASPAPVPGTSVCPKIASYTDAEQKALAGVLHNLNTDDLGQRTLLKVANEDHVLRLQLAACRATPLVPHF